MPRRREDAAVLCSISVAEARRRCAHGRQQTGLSAGLSCRCANSQFSTWYRPACLQPVSIECRVRAAYTAANFGYRPNQLHANGVHLEVTRDTNGPGKLASREPLAEWRAHSVTGIRQYTTEVDTG